MRKEVKYISFFLLTAFIAGCATTVVDPLSSLYAKEDMKIIETKNFYYPPLHQTTTIFKKDSSYLATTAFFADSGYLIDGSVEYFLSKILYPAKVRLIGSKGNTYLFHIIDKKRHYNLIAINFNKKQIKLYYPIELTKFKTFYKHLFETQKDPKITSNAKIARSLNDIPKINFDPKIQILSPLAKKISGGKKR